MLYSIQNTNTHYLNKIKHQKVTEIVLTDHFFLNSTYLNKLIKSHTRL